MKSYREFFAELKRRHVFKVAAIYGAVAFGLLQVADPLASAMNLPETFVPFVVALLILGFPVALVLAWAFEVTPEGVHRLSPASEGEIEQILAQPASQRWPAGILALVGVGLLVAGAWWAGTRAERSRADDAGAADAATSAPAGSSEAARLAFADADTDPRPSIAVLPFVNMSADANQEYFSDGITEEILNTLAKIRELKVAARTSAFAFRGSSIDMRAIGDSLDVGYLIEGSVRKAGDELRITAQLIDAGDGSHLWSETYDRTLDDVFAIQSEIAEAIAEALRVPLGLADASDLVAPTADLEAYDLYLAGRTKIRDRGENLREAVRLFEAAIARDSNWAPAWAALAEAQELRSWYPASWDRPTTTSEAYNAAVGALHTAAERAAKRAIALDPNLGSAHVALGSVYRNQREWKASEREYLRALALDPDDPEAHQQYAEMLTDVGRVAESVRFAERAVQMDAAPVRLLQLSGSLWADVRPVEALDALRQGILLDPDGYVPMLRGQYYLFQMARGEFDEAIDQGFHSGGLITTSPETHAAVLEAIAAEDRDLLPAEYRASPAFVALMWRHFGDRDMGLDGAEMLRAEDRHGPLVWLWFPEFDGLREQPRFQDILADINLENAVLERTARDTDAAAGAAE